MGNSQALPGNPPANPENSQNVPEIPQHVAVQGNHQISITPEEKADIDSVSFIFSPIINFVFLMSLSFGIKLFLWK